MKPLVNLVMEGGKQAQVEFQESLIVYINKWKKKKKSRIGIEMY
jgi:hypothetical protein